MTKHHPEIRHGNQVYGVHIRPNSLAHNELGPNRTVNLATHLNILIHAKSIRMQTDRRLSRYEEFYSGKTVNATYQDAIKHEEESEQKLMTYINNQPERREIAAFWLATKGRVNDGIGQFNPLDTQRLIDLGIELTPKY